MGWERLWGTCWDGRGGGVCWWEGVGGKWLLFCNVRLVDRFHVPACTSAHILISKLKGHPLLCWPNFRMHTDVQTLGAEYPQYRLASLLSVCSCSTLENLSALVLPLKTQTSEPVGLERNESDGVPVFTKAPPLVPTAMQLPFWGLSSNPWTVLLSYK